MPTHWNDLVRPVLFLAVTNGAKLDDGENLAGVKGVRGKRVVVPDDREKMRRAEFLLVQNKECVPMIMDILFILISHHFIVVGATNSSIRNHTLQSG